MKPEDIRELTGHEVEKRIEQIEEELFRLRFRSATQPLENPSLLKELRKDLARMKTIVRERELAEQAGE